MRGKGKRGGVDGEGWRGLEEQIRKSGEERDGVGRKEKDREDRGLSTSSVYFRPRGVISP